MTAPVLGLRANWKQFSLLVLINAFVGAMIGLERTVLPLIAEREFGLASKTAALSFIFTFGLVKAVSNVAAGWLGDRVGRRRTLIVGWLFGLPVPILVMLAPSWSWIIAANVLLGVNQGLTWSMTVVMKIDLAGPERRGFAMGLNEFAGYIAVALTALATGMIAQRFGLRPEPFYLGIAVAALGAALSVLFVRDTTTHVRHEATLPAAAAASHHSGVALTLREQMRASWSHPALGNASQVGLVNNLNDGLAWGIFPLFFAAAGLSIGQIGVLAFVYPATWGIAQLATGALSDRLGRKWLIVAGMLLQGGALIAMVWVNSFAYWIATGVLLGIGTAMVYPTLLAVIGDVAHPSWRGSAVGMYRLWRDSGYVVGALAAGVLSDFYGMTPAIAAVGCLTLVSGLVAALRMPETATLASTARHRVGRTTG
ncbi:MAG: MFS transporter [Gemmatimonadaceae bacterium]